MRINHIFLRHFMTLDHQEAGLPTTESFHTHEFYKEYQNYICPVDSTWTSGVGYQISVTPKVSWQMGDMEKVLFDDHLNVVHVPMHYPTWRWFNEFYPQAMHDLEILSDEINNKQKIAIVWDYNNESLLPGNFANNETQLDILRDKDFSKFYCSTLAWNRTNVLDTIGFREIISCMNGLGGLWYFSAIKEDPTLKNANTHTETGRHYPIRYFCPNNMFRPNRAMGIVKMHQKGMLDDTEWNMNKFSSWYEMSRFHPDDKFYLNYVDEYFKLFGITPRTMSHPWNKQFNLDRIKQDLGDYSHSNKSSYDTFDRDLMQKAYIYICQETFTNAPTEEPINPLLPVHVGDFSEKILKGYLYGKPTFVNARQGTLKILENLGFDNLTDLCTYDYDSEPDDNVRIDQMLESAKNFPRADNSMELRMRANNTLVRSKKFWWDGQKELIEKLLDNHT